MADAPYFSNRYIDQPLSPVRFRSPMMRVGLMRDVDDRIMAELRDPQTLESLARVKVRTHAACFENSRYAQACKADNSIHITPLTQNKEAFNKVVAALDAVAEEGQFHRIRPALAGGYEGDAAYGAKDALALLKAVEKAFGPVQNRVADSTDKYFEPVERAQGMVR